MSAHNTIVTWLAPRCMQSRPDLDLYQGQGLRVEAYRGGRAKPDAEIAPEARFAGHGEWADPDGALTSGGPRSPHPETQIRAGAPSPYGPYAPEPAG